MKYLLAVVVALFSQTHGTFLKHTEKTANCAVCANQNLNDQQQFKRCNYWGDPHYTATWGPRQRFDYQGKGLHSVVDNTECGGFKVQAFHCQYKSSQNTVTIGLAFSWTEESSGTTVRVFMNSNGISVQENSIDLAPGTVKPYVSVPNGPVTSAQWKSGVSVQTGNECNYALVTLKTISGKPGYIMSVNLRAHDEVDADQGICGTDDLGSTYIGDVSNSIFLPAEQSQLCTLCDSFGGGGGDGTPGCPNVPTTTVAPPTFSPRCAWAQTGYEQSGGNAAGSYFLQLAECAIDGSSLATTRYIANRAGATNYQVPTDFEEVCLMFYEKRSGSANCRTVCEQLGSTCNRVLAAIGADGTDKCETDNNNNGGNCGYDDENADDVQTFNDQICACNIPPGGLNNPAPGENLDDIDEQTQADATDACAVGWLANVTLPDPIPVDLSELTEEQFALWSCIIDWSLADPQDRPDIVELTEEQNPTLPITPCASSDGTLPEAGAEPCRCGAASCSQGQFCDAENDVCLASCASDTSVCDGTVALPAQNQIPCGASVCTASECCLPTCADGSPAPAACACATNTCTSGETCESGSCVAPSAPPADCSESQPAAGDCTCGGTTCNAGQFCESGSSTCLNSCATASTSICNGTGLLPNANSIPCDVSGCTAGTCCSSGSTDVTCSSYDCTGLRWHADPAKASLTCKPSGCDHYTCCKFLRLRRRRRKGQYYNDNGNGYYAGSPELIATEESEDSAFMQQEAYCENDDECEEEELGAETEL
ncbi:SLC38A6 [Symbiodinium microadriaticum]|nr:SLC38A6 [Symbiodinium microadriaticum]